MVLQLKDVDLQYLAVLAHFAENDRSCLVEIRVYDNVRKTNEEKAFENTYPLDSSGPKSWLVNTAHFP